MHLPIIARRSLLPVLLAAVAACSTTAPVSTIDSGPLEARAADAMAAGDLATAAALYRQMAATARGGQRADYLLQAAGLLIRLGDYPAASAALLEARGSATAAQQAALETLTARVDVAGGRAAEALSRLDALGPIADPALASLGAEARGLALFALGRPADAVAVLVEREIWLNSSAEILANQRLIWDGLATLRTPPPTVDDDIVAGWLALAPLTRLENDAAAFRRALLEWRARFGTHPAAGGVLAEIVAAHRGALDFPQRIALLLPLDSALRAPAEAVRDGFLAARLADPRAAETTVTIYDTAGRGAVEAYAEAQADGADFIVGPLLPEDVDRIVPLAGFVPTLALNFSQLQGGVFPSSLFQYALSPEDEARAIAERAIAEGQTTAIALHASTDRGYRLMASFRESFEALGGTILGVAAYVPESQTAGRNAPQNAADLIAGVLNISRSEQRHRRLQANLGTAVQFESRRRQDVDMIFLQASASLGRLLAPQLRFHKAGDIPTYATSDIYDTARAGREPDLNGVIFPDLPILLTPDPDATRLAATLTEFWPQQARQIRFYGFGYDAYRLIDPIYDPEPGVWPIDGLTGVLQVAEDGRIHRTLPFARFENGTPNALAPIVLPPGGAPAPPRDALLGAR